MSKGPVFFIRAVIVLLSLVSISLFTFLALTPSSPVPRGDTEIHELPPQLVQLQTFFRGTQKKKKNNIFLSIIILTYNNAPLVNRTLSTLLQQQYYSDSDGTSSFSVIPPWRWEVLLVDNGCFPSTRDVYNHHHRYHAISSASRPSSSKWRSQSTVRYIPLCNNTRYSVANNLAVTQYAASSAEWLLFLNDDVVPQQQRRGAAGAGAGGGFLWNFHSLLYVYSRDYRRRVSPRKHSLKSGGEESTQNQIGAVGCKLLFGDVGRDNLASGVGHQISHRHKVVEAGSVILASGKTDNYLRDADACENQGRHVRRIHYSSGACVFVRKNAFEKAGGFAEQLYEAYYEDTHLQMHLRHHQHLQILYSPFTQALHVEHGTFGQSDSQRLMDTSRATFLASWATELQGLHPRTALPSELEGRALGALSAHLLSKDDTTVFESNPQNEGKKVLRALVVGTAMEVALAAAAILALQATERYVITALVLSYPDYVESLFEPTRNWKHNNNIKKNGTRFAPPHRNCLKGKSLLQVGDALVHQQMMMPTGSDTTNPPPPLSFSSGIKSLLYNRVMRMLRLKGVEVLWESMLDDSETEDGRGGESHSGRCMKDIDGCDCGPDFYQNAVIRTNLDHLLTERDGFYDLVLNLDTGMRAPLSHKHRDGGIGISSNGDWVSVCDMSSALRIGDKKITVSDIAPAAANKLKKVSKHYSYLKNSKMVDMDFKVLNNFPFFVNVNIQASHTRNSFNKSDEEVNTHLHLPPKSDLLSQVDVSVRFEIMMAKHRTEVDFSPANESPHAPGQGSYNKFMSLIRSKQLAEHHSSADVTTVQADTQAGFYAFCLARHQHIIADLECLMHAMVERACVSATEIDSQGGITGIHCHIDENNGNPQVLILSKVKDGWDMAQPSNIQFNSRVVFEPRFRKNIEESKLFTPDRHFEIADVTAGESGRHSSRPEERERVLDRLKKAFSTIAPSSCPHYCNHNITSESVEESYWIHNLYKTSSAMVA